MNVPAPSRSRRRRGRIATSVAAIAVTVLASFLAAPVADAADAPAPPPAISAAEQSNLDALLAASNNSGDVAVFDVEKARQLGADEASTNQFATAFVESGGTLVGDPPDKAAAMPGIRQGKSAQADCRGVSGYTGWFWFGPQTALDSCLTTSLINGIGIAAGGGGVYAAASALTAAGLPASAVVGAVSAILALGVAFINTCKDTSSLNAIYLNGGIPGIVPPSCWAQ